MEGLRGADTGPRDSMTDGRCGLLMGAWNAGRAQSVSLWPRKWCQEPSGFLPFMPSPASWEGLRVSTEVFPECGYRILGGS